MKTNRFETKSNRNKQSFKCAEARVTLDSLTNFVSNVLRPLLNDNKIEEAASSLMKYNSSRPSILYKELVHHKGWSMEDAQKYIKQNQNLCIQYILEKVENDHPHAAYEKLVNYNLAAAQALKKKHAISTPTDLIRNDSFKAAENIFGPNRNTKYIELEDLHQNIKYEFLSVASGAEALGRAYRILKNSRTIAFNSLKNFYLFGMEEKFLTLIQFSTQNEIFIFDSKSLRSNQEFVDFVINILENKSIKKLGHRTADQITLLSKMFDRTILVNNVTDLAEIFRNWKGYSYEERAKTQIKYMVENNRLIKEKKYSTLELTSNWDVRPLRKTQLHFACLNVRILLTIAAFLEERGQHCGFETVDFEFANKFGLAELPKKVKTNSLTLEIKHNSEVSDSLASTDISRSGSPKNCDFDDNTFKNLQTLSQNTRELSNEEISRIIPFSTGESSGHKNATMEIDYVLFKAKPFDELLQYLPGYFFEELTQKNEWNKEIKKKSKLL